MIVDGRLGKLKNHAIRVEFQVRRSPLTYINSYAPILSNNNIDEYITFIEFSC